MRQTSNSSKVSTSKDQESLTGRVAKTLVKAAVKSVIRWAAVSAVTTTLGPIAGAITDTVVSADELLG